MEHAGQTTGLPYQEHNYCFIINFSHLYIKNNILFEYMKELLLSLGNNNK